MRTLLIELRARLEEASARLADVTVRKMFGCEAFLAGGKIFAVVWREGRIGLKLPDAQASAMRALPGASAWKLGDMVMRQWVLVPETFHDDAEALTGWVEQAHAAALVLARSSPPAKRRSPGRPAPRQKKSAGRTALGRQRRARGGRR
jgi:TfoX/Sxy family transcriptional regulator of competence genes